MKYGITTWRNSHSDCLTHIHSGKNRCFINLFGSFFPNSRYFTWLKCSRHCSAFRLRSDSLTRFRGFMAVQFGQNLHHVTPLSSLSFGRARIFSSGTQLIVPVMSKSSRLGVLRDWLPDHLPMSLRPRFLQKNI